MEVIALARKKLVNKEAPNIFRELRTEVEPFITHGLHGMKNELSGS